MTRQGRQKAVTLFQSFTQQLAEKVRTKTQAFFLPLLYGILLAIAQRRTVTTWLRAAQISDDFRSVFYHKPSIGRKSNDLLNAMSVILFLLPRKRIAARNKRFKRRKNNNQLLE